MKEQLWEQIKANDPELARWLQQHRGRWEADDAKFFYELRQMGSGLPVLESARN